MSIRPATHHACVLLLLFTVGATLSAQVPTGTALRWAPDPAYLPFAGRTLNWDDRVKLSFIASGVAQDRIATYENRLRSVLAQARAATAGLTPAETADQLLQFLHRGTFRAYNFYQTRIDVLLDTGVFNCVSSAVVYNLLAEALGLSTGAVSTPDHAFSTVRIGNRLFDVETTTPLGFDPGTRREFHNAFGTLTGFAYVPPGNYAQRTTIDDRQLIGLIIQNRMTEDQRRGDSTTPVALAWDLSALEGMPAAKRLLYRSYSNYLVGMNNAREYAQGLAVIQRLEATVGRNAQTDTLAATFAQNLIIEHMSAADYPGARAAVKEWAVRTDRSAAQWLSLILKSESEAIYRTKGWAATLSWLDRQRDVPESELAAVRLSVALQEAQQRMQGGNWEAGYQFLKSLPAGMQAQPEFVKMQEVLVYNLSVGYHNRFADFMNQGRITDGAAVLKDGLTRFPDSRMLKQDQAQLDRYLQTHH